MKRLIVQTRIFSDALDLLIKKRRLLRIDFEAFEVQLVTHPDLGDVIQGTGGLRKTRLKSSTGGKSGGFRVCYCDIPEKEKLFLIVLFPKNVREDLKPEEKKELRYYVEKLKNE